MNKTLRYWIERLSGVLLGILAMVLFFNFWDLSCTASDSPNLENLFEKLITISTTLFGFLLTVLTLIVQSESQAIKKMKEHGSYERLIRFNKHIVLLSGLICLLSLFLSFFCKYLFTSYEVHSFVAKTLTSFNIGVFIWTITDTLLFTLIFYKIILSNQQ